MAENEENTDKWKDILCSWMEELILLKCHYPKPSTNSVQFLSNFNGISHRNRANNPKMCLDPKQPKQSLER